jgi:hypothetical protein
MADTRKNTKTEKPYDGKIKGDTFDVINRCQALASDIFVASAGASKEYRFTVCKVIQTYSCELIHTARQANSFDLYTQSSDRMKGQKDAYELMEKISDLLPVVRRCRCISLGQEKELNKKLTNLKYAFKKWTESDVYRLKCSKTDKNK